MQNPQEALQGINGIQNQQVPLNVENLRLHNGTTITSITTVSVNDDAKSYGMSSMGTQYLSEENAELNKKLAKKRIKEEQQAAELLQLKLQLEQVKIFEREERARVIQVETQAQELQQQNQQAKIAKLIADGDITRRADEMQATELQRQIERVRSARVTVDNAIVVAEQAQNTSVEQLQQKMSLLQQFVATTRQSLTEIINKQALNTANINKLKVHTHGIVISGWDAFTQYSEIPRGSDGKHI